MSHNVVRLLYPGWLEVGLGLDRETAPRHSLVVEARDPTSGLLAALYLTVEVTDTNDHAPTFLHPTYTALVPEDAPPGTLLADLPATVSHIHTTTLPLLSLLPVTTQLLRPTYTPPQKLLFILCI